MPGHSTKLRIEKASYFLISLDNLLYLYILKMQSKSSSLTVQCVIEVHFEETIVCCINLPFPKQ